MKHAFGSSVVSLVVASLFRKSWAFELLSSRHYRSLSVFRSYWCHFRHVEPQVRGRARSARSDARYRGNSSLNCAYYRSIVQLKQNNSFSARDSCRDWQAGVAIVQAHRAPAMECASSAEGENQPHSPSSLPFLPLNINTAVLFSSMIALAGGNFCVVASDTRMTQHDVNVMARDVDKVHPLWVFLFSFCSIFSRELPFKPSAFHFSHSAIND